MRNTNVCISHDLIPKYDTVNNYCVNNLTMKWTEARILTSPYDPYYSAIRVIPVLPPMFHLTLPLDHYTGISLLYKQFSCQIFHRYVGIICLISTISHCISNTPSVSVWKEHTNSLFIKVGFLCVVTDRVSRVSDLAKEHIENAPRMPPVSTMRGWTTDITRCKLSRNIVTPYWKLQISFIWILIFSCVFICSRKAVVIDLMAWFGLMLEYVVT